MTVAASEGSILFAKAARNQLVDGLDGRRRLFAGGLDRDGRPGRGAQHHQSHDRGAAHRFTATGDPDGRVEALHGLTELGRGAGVQALLVDDGQHADGGVGRVPAFGQIAVEVLSSAHFPASTRLAMVTYLRPAAWAAATASSSGHSLRTLASFTSIGMLMPASTSTLGRPMQEIARFEGVPPNMSVRIATPSPVSTRLTASMMSLRHCSTSSSGPMVTASIWVCGPTTCSSAARNSTASRPCVTSTRPIMEAPAGASPVAPHERGPS